MERSIQLHLFLSALVLASGRTVPGPSNCFTRPCITSASRLYKSSIQHTAEPQAVAFPTKGEHGIASRVLFSITPETVRDPAE